MQRLFRFSTSVCTRSAILPTPSLALLVRVVPHATSIALILCIELSLVVFFLPVFPVRVPLLRFAIMFGNAIDVLKVEFKERLALIDHPGQSEVGEGSVRIPASYIAVYTREPALPEDDGYKKSRYQGRRRQVA